MEKCPFDEEWVQLAREVISQNTITTPYGMATSTPFAILKEAVDWIEECVKANEE